MLVSELTRPAVFGGAFAYPHDEQAQEAQMILCATIAAYDQSRIADGS